MTPCDDKTNYQEIILALIQMGTIAFQSIITDTHLTQRVVNYFVNDEGFLMSQAGALQQTLFDTTTDFFNLVDEPYQSRSKVNSQFVSYINININTTNIC